jgi:hypothetical protein
MYIARNMESYWPASTTWRTKRSCSANALTNKQYREQWTEDVVQPGAINRERRTYHRRTRPRDSETRLTMPEEGEYCTTTHVGPNSLQCLLHFGLSK